MGTLDDATTFISVAGVGVQRLVEALDPVWDYFGSKWGAAGKKTAATAAAVVIGTFIAGATGLGLKAEHVTGLGIWLVNGLLIAGGTEAFNSVIKILSAAKVASVNKATQALPSGSPQAIASALPDVPPFDLSAPPA